MADTSIEWTEKTWNPIRGCSVVSAGCTNCYAMRTAHRFSGPGEPYHGLTRARTKLGPVWTGDVRFVDEKLSEPLSWRKPQRVFVNSMSDLFHENVSDEQIAAVFGVIAAAPRHTFQVLTKRPERARAWFKWAHAAPIDPQWGRGARQVRLCTSLALPGSEHAFTMYEASERASQWPLQNVWLGVSVEDQQTADERVAILLELPAAVRWVSYEPALGLVNFKRPWLVAQHLPSWGRRSDGVRGCDSCCNGDRCDSLRHVDRSQCTACGGSGALPDRGLDWIVVGGESGPGARPFDIAWARSTIAQCREAGTKCFVKQLGARATSGGAPFGTRDRKGGDPSEWPEDLRVREYPEVRRVA